jgi:hypothetical protein
MLGNILNMGREFGAKIIKVFPPIHPERAPRMDIPEFSGKENII